MRRAKPEEREIFPDIRYNSVPVQTMVQHVLKRGKKSVALGLVYDAMDLIKERTQKSPIEVFETALKNVSPVMEVRPRRWAAPLIRFLWKSRRTAAPHWRSAGFCLQPVIAPANPFRKSWPAS